MFYEAAAAPQAEGDISALVVLSPSQGRRLLAKAVVACAEVQKAYKNGMIILGRGITNAYVSEELFGIEVEPKAAQTVGMVADGMLNCNTAPPPCTSHVVENGQVVENADSNAEILKFKTGDVFLKGANAVDPQGVPGVYVASLKAGTVGMSWPIVMARRAHMIIPVSLEKMVPDVMEAAKHTGVYHFKYSMGIPVSLIPIPMALVITEIQAMAILCGVRAVHVGSGGIAGSEGSVHLCLSGPEAKINAAMDLVKSMANEPPASMTTQTMITKPEDYNFDSQSMLDTLGGI